MDRRWCGWERWAALNRVFREVISEEVIFLPRPE